MTRSEPGGHHPGPAKNRTPESYGFHTSHEGQQRLDAALEFLPGPASFQPLVFVPEELAGKPSRCAAGRTHAERPERVLAVRHKLFLHGQNPLAAKGSTHAGARRSELLSRADGVLQLHARDGRRTRFARCAIWRGPAPLRSACPRQIAPLAAAITDLGPGRPGTRGIRRGKRGRCSGGRMTRSSRPHGPNCRPA